MWHHTFLDQSPNVFLKGLAWVENFKYLGHVLTSGSSLSDGPDMRRAKFVILWCTGAGSMFKLGGLRPKARAKNRLLSFFLLGFRSLHLEIEEKQK